MTQLTIIIIIERTEWDIEEEEMKCQLKTQQ